MTQYWTNGIGKRSLEWALVSLLPVLLFAMPKAAGEEPRRYAKLGSVDVTSADVDLQLGRVADSAAGLPELPEGIAMATIDIIAKQRQALATLTQQKRRVPNEEIDRWLIDNTPADPKMSASEALASRAQAAGVAEETYRDFLAFRFSWQNYIKQQINESNLQKHFNNQKPRFDGSRFRIQHAYIVVPPGASSARASARSKLVELKTKIQEADGDWKEQAARLAPPAMLVTSEDPLWITGSGPVLPAVVDVVIQLKPGNWSDPFDSGQAVHLVKLEEIQPGSRTQQEAGEELRRHMLMYLLDFLAKQSAKELPLVWNESK